MFRSKLKAVFEEDLSRLCRRSDDEAPFREIRCPEALAQVLAENGLFPDLDTDTKGDCGIDAFIRSASTGGVALKAERSGRRSMVLKPVTQKNRQETLRVVRAVGVEWLRAHSKDTVWGEWTVERFCQYISGHTSHDDYCDAMATDHEWIDTGFMHAIACAFRVDVLIFQIGMDPVFVGTSFHQSGVPLALVPVGLVNDRHFWGVGRDDQPCPFSDKGDPYFDNRQFESGMGPGCRPCLQDEEDCLDESVACPMEDEPTRSPEEVCKELSLCSALVQWNPWQYPTQDLVDAMQPCVQSPQGRARDAVVTRRAVLMELALESAAAEGVDRKYTYTRATRWIVARPCAAWAALGDRRARISEAQELLALFRESY